MVTLLAPDYPAVSYISNFMRQADRDEIYNVIGHANPWLLARAAIDACGMGHGVVAHVRGVPVAILGYHHLRPGVGVAFAFATDAFPRAALSLTRYALRVMRPMLRAQGYHRLECQSRYGHDAAHRWLEMMGFRCEGVLRKYGSDGSDYLQFGAT